MEKKNWQEIELLVSTIARKAMEAGKGYGVIVAIGRGGMIPAAMLAHQLGVRFCDYVNYSRKTGFIGDSFGKMNNFTEMLFIDDATETGGTFKFIKEQYPNADTAVLLMKDTCEVGIDFVGETYSGDCPQMAWER